MRKRKEKRLVVADYLVGDLAVEGDRVTFALEAKATGALRPDVFMRACVEQAVAAGVLPADARVIEITRTAQRTHDGEML